MKKLMAVLLALVLVFGLAACGKKSVDAQYETVDQDQTGAADEFIIPV